MTNIAVVVFPALPLLESGPHCVSLGVIFPWQCNKYLHSSVETTARTRLPHGGEPCCAT